MLEFRIIDISDQERIKKALKVSDFRGCEYSFANNMAWRRLADSKIAFYKDFYIVCAFDTEDGYPHYIMPSGSGNHKELFAELKKYSDSMNAPVCINGVTEQSLVMLHELFGDSFAAKLSRDDCDYIYNTSDLIELPGKKYHAKRNHLARFNESGCEFSLITEKDFDDCIFFCTENYNKNGSSEHSFVAEQFAINTYFNYFGQLGLKGGILRKNGKITAVTIGEPLNSDTFCVHIEKADTSVNGIYAGINNSFAKASASDFKYINREEDLGIEGLRRSKLSYHPAFLLNKYTVIFK